MKIAIQVSTSTMGDIVIETSEEKNTQNEEQQKGILVELIWDAVRKVKAVYNISDGLLDIGDYETADSRYQKEQATPKPSSAEANRQRHIEAHPAQASHNSCCQQHKGAEEPEGEEEMDELSEAEMVFALNMIQSMRDSGVNFEIDE